VLRESPEEELTGKEGWEEFLRLERQNLEDRLSGQLARALGWALTDESPQEIQRMAREDRRRAEEGLVELIQNGKFSYKHIDDLTPEDMLARLRAESARISWVKERQKLQQATSSRRAGR
jgi:hypothetical protein